MEPSRAIADAAQLGSKDCAAAALPQTFVPDENARPYVANPRSACRIKLAFRVDFSNGGHVEGEDFLLDLLDVAVTPGRAAEMIVSSMNLVRAGRVTVRAMQVVRRGEHGDSAPD